MKTRNIHLKGEDPSQDWQGFSVEIRYLVAQATIDAGIRAVSANPARLAVTTMVATENPEQAANRNAKTANKTDTPPALTPEPEKVGATQRAAVASDGTTKFVLPDGAESRSLVVLAPDRSRDISDIVEGSTVVQTTQQHEQVTASTEVVANHNHGRSLTMEYFEVLAHYWVAQDYVVARECLFVPLLYKHFTLNTLAQFGDILRNYFKFDYRHPAFTGFEAAERMIANEIQMESPASGAAGAAVTITPPSPTNETIKSITGEFNVVFHLNASIKKTNAKSTPEGDEPAESELEITKSACYVSILTPEKISIVNWNPFEGLSAAATHFETKVAPAIAELFIRKLAISVTLAATAQQTNILVKATLVESYMQGESLRCRLTFELPQGHSLKCSDLTNFKITVAQNLETYSGAEVKSIKITASTANFPTIPLMNISNANKVLDTTATTTEWLSNTISQTITNTANTAVLETQTTTDRRAVRNLLRHLNEHTEYYHVAVWRNLDEYRRYNMLDGMAYNMPNKNGGYDWISVASIVENTLVDIVGNSLVFPVARGLRINPCFDKSMDLSGYFRPAVVQSGFGISVPTPGLFAEAILGACNAAELVDDKRAQDWTKFTADEPTGIDSLNTNSRYQAPPNMDAKDMPQPIINIQNAPAAPDPQGLNALSSILNNGNLFRDATGMDALSKLTTEQIQAVSQNNAKLTDSANQMAENAHQYNMNKQAVKDGLLHPKDAAAAERERTKPQRQKDSDAYNQKVADIKNNPNLTEAQKQAAIARLTDSYSGGTSHEAQHTAAVTTVKGLGANGEMDFYENGQVKGIKNGEPAPEPQPMRITRLFQLPENLRSEVYARIAYAYNDTSTAPSTGTPPSTDTGVDDGTGTGAVSTGILSRVMGAPDDSERNAALEDFFAQGNAVLLDKDGGWVLDRKEEELVIDEIIVNKKRVKLKEAKQEIIPLIKNWYNNYYIVNTPNNVRKFPNEAAMVLKATEIIEDMADATYWTSKSKKSKYVFDFDSLSQLQTEVQFRLLIIQNMFRANNQDFARYPRLEATQTTLAESGFNLRNINDWQPLRATVVNNINPVGFRYIGSNAANSINQFYQYNLASDNQIVIDCATMLGIVHYQSMIEIMGSAKFNEFSTESGGLIIGPVQQRFSNLNAPNSAFNHSLHKAFKPVAFSSLKDLVPGDRVAFKNNGGAELGLWAGEFAIYIGIENGQPMFDGFGATRSYDNMIAFMRTTVTNSATSGATISGEVPGLMNELFRFNTKGLSF